MCGKGVSGCHLLPGIPILTRPHPEDEGALASASLSRENTARPPHPRTHDPTAGRGPALSPGSADVKTGPRDETAAPEITVEPECKPERPHAVLTTVT